MKSILYIAVIVSLSFIVTACSSKKDSKGSEGKDSEYTSIVEQRKDSVADLSFMGCPLDSILFWEREDFYDTEEKNLELNDGKHLSVRFLANQADETWANHYIAYAADCKPGDFKSVLDTFLDKYGAFSYCYQGIGLWPKDMPEFKGYNPAYEFCQDYHGFAYRPLNDEGKDIKVEGRKFFSDYYNITKDDKQALDSMMNDIEKDLKENRITEINGKATQHQATKRPYFTFVWEWKNQSIELMVSYNVVSIAYINGGYVLRKQNNIFLNSEEEKCSLNDDDNIKYYIGGQKQSDNEDCMIDYYVTAKNKDNSHLNDKQLEKIAKEIAARQFYKQLQVKFYDLNDGVVCIYKVASITDQSFKLADSKEKINSDEELETIFVTF